MPVLLVLVGIPGSGKSFVAQQLCTASPAQWTLTREDTSGDWRQCEDMALQALSHGQNVIVDRCNVSERQRAPWMELARHARSTRVQAVAVQLLLPLQQCIRRLKDKAFHHMLRPEAVEDTCTRMYNDFVTVQPFEQFSKVFTIHHEAEVPDLIERLNRHIAILSPTHNHGQHSPEHSFTQPLPSASDHHQKRGLHHSWGQGSGPSLPSEGSVPPTRAPKRSRWDREAAPVYETSAHDAWGVEQNRDSGSSGQALQQLPGQQQMQVFVEQQQQWSWQQQVGVPWQQLWPGHMPATTWQPPDQYALWLAAQQQQQQPWQHHHNVACNSSVDQPRALVAHGGQPGGWAGDSGEGSRGGWHGGGVGVPGRGHGGDGGRKGMPRDEAVAQLLRRYADPTSKVPYDEVPASEPDPRLAEAAQVLIENCHTSSTHAEHQADGNGSIEPAPASTPTTESQPLEASTGATVSASEGLGCDAAGSQAAAVPDQRPILLFDLNGTITSHTAQRYSSGKNKPRPGIKQLLQLKPKFRLGVFTSATVRTVATALAMLEAEAGVGPGELFEYGLVLHRDHTCPLKEGAKKSWDTAKPLGNWFARLDRVVLFDDDEHKALPQERGNLVRVPCWSDNDQEDGLVEELVHAVEEVLGGLEAGADVREHTDAVTRRLDKWAEHYRSTRANESSALPDGEDGRLYGEHQVNGRVIPIDPQEVVLDDKEEEEEEQGGERVEEGRERREEGDGLLAKAEAETGTAGGLQQGEGRGQYLLPDLQISPADNTKLLEGSSPS